MGCKIFVIRGSVRSVGRPGYAAVYVYADSGGRELSKHIGEEVEGILVVRDEGCEDADH